MHGMAGGLNLGSGLGGCDGRLFHQETNEQRGHERVLCPITDCSPTIEISKSPFTTLSEGLKPAKNGTIGDPGNHLAVLFK